MTKSYLNNPGKSYVSTKDRERMRQLYTVADSKLGRTLTLSEIAEMFGVAISTVSRSVEDGVESAYQAPLTTAQIKLAMQRRRAKPPDSWPKIGEALGRAHGYVYNAVRRYCKENKVEFV